MEDDFTGGPIEPKNDWPSREEKITIVGFFISVILFGATLVISLLLGVLP